MRTFILTDIHGYDEQFKKLLKIIGLKRTDKLILLGDYIDRGRQSKEVLDTILLLKEHDFDVIALRGNHEQMLLQTFDNSAKLPFWLKNGGDKTLTSFGTSHFNRIPAKYIEFLHSMPYYYDDGKHIYVHAGLNTSIDNPFDDTRSMLWMRHWESELNADWLMDRTIIYGHTPKDIAQIRKSIKKGQLICLDNGIYLERTGYGNLCALHLESKELYTLS